MVHDSRFTVIYSLHSTVPVELTVEDLALRIEQLTLRGILTRYSFTTHDSPFALADPLYKLLLAMDFSNDIENALKVLKEGGLILYPTDTIWGIGCDATSEEAVERVFVLKNRPSNKSLIILVADERDVLQYVSNPDLRVFDYLQEAERPTTVIYEGAIGLAPKLVSDDGSVAIRIVKDEFCKHLIKRFRKPIVSTSANVSGQPSPKNFQDIPDVIKNSVDYVVKHRQHENQESASSTIIHWKNGEAIVIRG